MEDCSIVIKSGFNSIKEFTLFHPRNPRKLADFSMETENEFTEFRIVEEN